MACPADSIQFARGESAPYANSSIEALAHRLSQSSGRYYVVAYAAPDEQDIPGLDLARANAVKARLVALGFCEEKLIPLAGGVVAEPGESSRPPDRVRALAFIALVSEPTDQQLRDAGILD